MWAGLTPWLCWVQPILQLSLVEVRGLQCSQAVITGSWLCLYGIVELALLPWICIVLVGSLCGGSSQQQCSAWGILWNLDRGTYTLTALLSTMYTATGLLELHLGWLQSAVTECGEQVCHVRWYDQWWPLLWNSFASHILALRDWNKGDSLDYLQNGFRVILPMSWIICPGLCLDDWQISPLSTWISPSFRWDGWSILNSLSLVTPFVFSPKKLSHFLQYG